MKTHACAAWNNSHSLKSSARASTTTNVQLVCHGLYLLETLRWPLDLVRHQLAVEVHCEDDKDDEGGNDDDCRDNRCTVAVAVKPNPSKNRHLDQKQQDAHSSRGYPSHLHVTAHTVVWRFLDRGEVVHVADGLNVRQDARADHESKQVYGYNQSCADAERNQETFGDVIPQLYLNHCNLNNIQKHTQCTSVLARYFMSEIVYSITAIMT